MDSDFVVQSMCVTMLFPVIFLPDMHSGKIGKTIFKLLGKRLTPWSLLWRTLWANILSKCQTEDQRLITIFTSISNLHHISFCHYFSSVADPGCLSRIPDPDFYPSRIQKQQQKRGVKKI